MARVWDLPVRITHWAFALLLPFSWWAAKSSHLDWHRLSGYVLLGLLLFRLIWGVVGSPTARFADFVRGPRAAADYLAGRATPRLGHNPLGGWSVLALFTVIAAQIGLGLFAVDEDSIEAGPLSSLVSFDTGRAIAHLHHTVFWVLAGLVALHLTAIAVYAARGRNLVAPMVTGVAPAPPGAPTPPLAPPWRILPAAALAAAGAWVIAQGLKL